MLGLALWYNADGCQAQSARKNPVYDLRSTWERDWEKREKRRTRKQSIPMPNSKYKGNPDIWGEKIVGFKLWRFTGSFRRRLAFDESRRHLSSIFFVFPYIFPICTVIVTTVTFTAVCGIPSIFFSMQIVFSCFFVHFLVFSSGSKSATCLKNYGHLKKTWCKSVEYATN